MKFIFCHFSFTIKIFFSLSLRYTSPAEVPRKYSGGGFFTGSKFKYGGRIEREVIAEMAQLSREEPQIQRVGSLRRKASSVPATPSTPVVNDLPGSREFVQKNTQFLSCGIYNIHDFYFLNRFSRLSCFTPSKLQLGRE